MADYIPAVGAVVPVKLPDELVRATVMNSKNRGDDLVVCLDIQEPMVKTHSYRKGDHLKASRDKENPTRGSVWIGGDKVNV